MTTILALAVVVALITILASAVVVALTDDAGAAMIGTPLISARALSTGAGLTGGLTSARALTTNKDALGIVAGLALTGHDAALPLIRGVALIRGAALLRAPSIGARAIVAP